MPKKVFIFTKDEYLGEIWHTLAFLQKSWFMKQVAFKKMPVEYYVIFAWTKYVFFFLQLSILQPISDPHVYLSQASNDL